jgi:hypothetical protein
MNLPTTFIDFCELLNAETFTHHPKASIPNRLSRTFFSFLSVADLLTLRGVCRSTSEIVG